MCSSTSLWQSKLSIRNRPTSATLCCRLIHMGFIFPLQLPLICSGSAMHASRLVTRVRQSPLTDYIHGPLRGVYPHCICIPQPERPSMYSTVVSGRSFEKALSWHRSSCSTSTSPFGAACDGGASEDLCVGTRLRIDCKMGQHYLHIAGVMNSF